MYHVIAAPPAGAPFPGLYVEPAEFAEQMHALAGAGWHAVTLDQVEAYWRRGVPLGARQADRDQLRQRLPVAVHAGAAGAARLGWVGDENLQLSGLPPSQGGLGRSADPRPARRGLGARHAGHQPRGPDHARRRAAALPGRRRAQDAPAALPRARQLVLLPVRPLRRRRSSRRSRRPASSARPPSCRAGRTRATTPTACTACACSAARARRRCSLIDDSATRRRHRAPIARERAERRRGQRRPDGRPAWRRSP